MAMLRCGHWRQRRRRGAKATGTDVDGPVGGYTRAWLRVIPAYRPCALRNPPRFTAGTLVRKQERARRLPSPREVACEAATVTSPCRAPRRPASAVRAP